MGLILFTVEMPARLADPTSFGVAEWLKNVARLQQQLVRICIDHLEPSTKLLVVLGIVNEFVYGIDNNVQAPPISEALKQCADLGC
jgi:hypothetical protein